MLDLFIFFGVCLLINFAISIVIWSIRNGIAPMPSSPKAKKTILISLPQEINGSIYELGSGWGTLLIPLARHYPLHRLIGVESSPIPYFFSKAYARLLRIQNITVLRQDFFHLPLGQAGLIVCYLYPEAMRKLKNKFEDELSPGTWVISNTFALPGWTPIHVYEVNDIYHSKIYFYQKKGPSGLTKI